MKRVPGLVLVFLAIAFASQAYAQFGKGAGPRFYSDFKPVVGGWSEYQMTMKGESSSKMKIAIVGKEGNDYWYETVMEGQREGKMISKMLVSGNPSEQKNVKRMMIKMGNEPAMEMPAEMMQRGAYQSHEPKGKVVDKGEETVKVPAGTFRTQHFQYQEGGTVVDAWIQKDISPYGTVKTQAKDFEMVLTGYGTGAKTLITETPKRFEMPKMQRGGVPKARKPGKNQGEEDED
ncbi:MAG: hypothetical protein EHM36_13290 [Deltaproteobacteria bacterium]|nr:MAG: hypothetical protein EHM36_13290 [Deltaproteobacteria bacterium]